jgi:alpha-L-rhamnosidase
MIEKGATTIWELWNGDTANPAMNSGNHVMLVGDLTIWLYQNLAGIKSADGYQTIEMEPLIVGDLTYVKAEYNSIRGIIKSHWRKSNDSFTWDFTIPVGSRAILTLPVKSAGDMNVKFTNGNPIKVNTNGKIEFASGTYQIIVTGDFK